MSAVSLGVFAVARTKRRRLLWCAWWSGEPTREPFRPPDAWAGGARDEGEARAAAELAAGRVLREIEGRWAGAWIRVMAGQAPWVTRPPSAGALPRAERPRDPYAILGVARDATALEIKRAFRALALGTHPDHGGDAEAFMRAKKAYDTALERVPTHKKR